MQVLGFLLQSKYSTALLTQWYLLKEGEVVALVQYHMQSVHESYETVPIFNQNHTQPGFSGVILTVYSPVKRPPNMEIPRLEASRASWNPA